MNEEDINSGTAFLEKVVDSLVSRGILRVPALESVQSELQPCLLQLASLLCDLMQVTQFSEFQYSYL